ncbi:MarR family winged helix-turn-helix transcriptional regulator [Sporomusa sp.]|uniref:MarR family winged helix-turn-helix transcriptional regulator n=1 Tax=Sporomusa sp. TaxID=2078658 RepID=UPI002B886ECC|nr:MarR family winged helix-turn-helix transcriptional regulator [Sporomusa sp.]HWR09779.1 MarR family winged helix-turn-helix transcriptional regulator [Sporomusa sp.]
MEIEQIRETFHLMTRRLGLIDKCGCKISEPDLSVVQSHILYEVNKRKGPSMQEVADALGMDITTFSRQVQTLVKLGLVAKMEQPEDRRVYMLSLTEQGSCAVTEISEQMNRYFQEVFSYMTEFEKETVIRSIHLLNRSLAQSSVCCSPVR